MILKLAIQSILRRPARHILLLLLIILACALPVFIIQLTSGLYNGLNRAVEPFPIIAGAKGSQYQLVFNTVFLKDRPIGNIPYKEVDKLRATRRASLVLPFAFGDNYRGFRIVGTEPEIFQYVQNRKKGPWITVAEGKAFAAEREVVIGSQTARLTGLHIGDTFKSVHGLAAGGGGHTHDHPYTVAGILAPVGGPYDTAILCDIKDVWEAHGGGKAHTEEEHDHEHEQEEDHIHAGEEAQVQKTAPAVRKGAALRTYPTVPQSDTGIRDISIHEEEHDHDHEQEAAHDHEEDHEHEHEHVHGLVPGEKGDVTAVLIQPKGYADAMQLLSQYQRNAGDVQMVFPSQSIISLYSMVGQTKAFWQIITAALMAAAVLITLLVMYWSSLARMKEFALIRALGGSSGYVFRLIVIENAMVLIVGAAAGWLAAWLGSLAMARFVAGQAAIVMTTAPELMGFLPPLIIAAAGTAAGILPAWIVRKKDISRYL